MKLWQKVFLCTLVLVLLAIDVTATAVMMNTYRTLVASEQEKAVTEHTTLCASLSNSLLYQRLQQGAVLLEPEEVKQSITGLLNKQPGGLLAAVYSESVCLTGEEPALLQKERGFVRKVAERDACLVKMSDYNGQYYTIAGSSLALEGRNYVVFTIKNSTDVYKMLLGQLRFIQVTGIGFAGMTGVALIFVVFRLLSPLEKLNRTIREFARGNYGQRAREEGSREFRELSGNINRMADAVEENISRIEQVSEGRKQFIDNMAHEMKTPLTSILGFADILRVKRTVGDDERRDYASIIVEETKRLQGLSAKLLEFATSRSAPLDWKRLNVPALFHEVQESMGPALSKRQITLCCSADQVELEADRELVLSLLYNLVDNASKVSSPGQCIHLDCKEVEDTVRLQVRDEGIGLTSQEIRQITEPFYRVDKSRSKKEGGAGLGLSLCARIVERHGAAMTFESKPGRGTTVQITMPKRQHGEGEPT